MQVLMLAHLRKDQVMTKSVRRFCKFPLWFSKNSIELLRNCWSTPIKRCTPYGDNCVFHVVCNRWWGRQSGYHNWHVPWAGVISAFKFILIFNYSVLGLEHTAPAEEKQATIDSTASDEELSKSILHSAERHSRLYITGKIIIQTSWRIINPCHQTSNFNVQQKISTFHFPTLSNWSFLGLRRRFCHLKESLQRRGSNHR